MDAVGIWLLVLVLLPFLLFFCRIFLIAWKSMILSKRIKNLSLEIEVTVWPSLAMASNSFNWTTPTWTFVYEPFPTEAPSVDYSYDVYSYIIVIFVLIVILGATKAAVNRKKSIARQRALSGARARQAQLSTVSGSVDANSTVSSEPPSTSQQPSDAHTKVDLPPTYEEVMKHFLDAKAAAAATSSETVVTVLSEPRTPAATEIDIEDSPPPQYSSIRP